MSNLTSPSIGLCRSVGKELYNQKVELTVQEITEENLGSSTVHHTVFSVVIETGKNRKSSAKGNHRYHMPDSSLITPRSFCELFPFHILFDSDLVIKQCGSNIARWSHKILEDSGLRLPDLFTLVKPQMPLTFDHIRRFCNANYILESKSKEIAKQVGPDVRSVVQLTLRGKNAEP